MQVINLFIMKYCEEVLLKLMIISLMDLLVKNITGLHNLFSDLMLNLSAYKLL